jgi:hypothetical protein
LNASREKNEENDSQRRGEHAFNDEEVLPALLQVISTWPLMSEMGEESIHVEFGPIGKHCVSSAYAIAIDVITIPICNETRKPVRKETHHVEKRYSFPYFKPCVEEG